jgi:hypothetical protein
MFPLHGHQISPCPACDAAESFFYEEERVETAQQRKATTMQTRICHLIFLSLLVIAGSQLEAQVDMLTQHNDNFRTGVNLQETVLSPANVNKAHFGMLFKREVDDQLYTQPLVVTGVTVGGGKRDLVYVTTVNNSVYSFDANDAAASAPVWHVNFGTPANVNSTNFGCLDINGQMGIVGTPVIDKERGVLYVVALTRVGKRTGPGTGFTQKLHELDLATGADLPESPVTIQAEDFDPLMQNQRPALALANGMVYVGYASHCDKDPYHGFLFAYGAKQLRQVSVLNTSPTGAEASIWQSGQGPAVDAQGNVYVVTGNGSWDGKQNFSESFLKLAPDLHLLDWFTPTDHFMLDKDDLDLNSSGATLIPGKNLVLGGGKSGVLYVLDTKDLGHLGDEHAVEHFQATASHLHSLVFWHSAATGDSLYVWGQRDKAKVYRMHGSRLDPTPAMTREIPNQGHPGAMLSLSANGDRNGILWAAIHATGDSWHESRPGVLHAYDADDIQKELWNSLQDSKRDDCGEYSKMAAPTIVNGKVYLASFGLENVGTGQLCVYGLLPASNPQGIGTPTAVKAVVLQNQLELSWNPQPGAKLYRVIRKTGSEGRGKFVAFGLTTPMFAEPVPVKGEAVSYSIVAVGADGVSAASAFVSVQIAAPHDQMPH